MGGGKTKSSTQPMTLEQRKMTELVEATCVETVRLLSFLTRQDPAAVKEALPLVSKVYQWCALGLASGSLFCVVLQWVLETVEQASRQRQRETGLGDRGQAGTDGGTNENGYVGMSAGSINLENAFRTCSDSLYLFALN